MDSIIVDTNILFSAILKIDSIISKIIIENNKFTFYTPDFSIDELNKHKDKLIKLAKYEQHEYDEIYNIIFHRVIILNNNIIPNKIFIKANEYCKNIDEKDTIFVAYALFFNSKLWTGDKKLITGLKEKGFSQIIETKEMLELYIARN